MRTASHRFGCFAGRRHVLLERHCVSRRSNEAACRNGLFDHRTVLGTTRRHPAVSGLANIRQLLFTLENLN